MPPPLPLVTSQVNITLLDINDNHPTWKDAPYYINLVEMTPPDSDVTTVRGGGQRNLELPFLGCPPFLCGSPYRLVHVGLIDLMFPSEPACGADFQKLSCTAEGNQRLAGTPHPVLRGSGLQALSKGARSSARACPSPQDSACAHRRAATLP